MINNKQWFFPNYCRKFYHYWHVDAMWVKLGQWGCLTSQKISSFFLFMTSRTSRRKGGPTVSDALHSVLYLWDVSIWYSIWIPVSATGGSRQAETCSVCKCQVGRVFFPKTLRELLPWQVICGDQATFFRQLCLSTPICEILSPKCGRCVKMENYKVHLPPASSYTLKAQRATAWLIGR